MLLDRRQLQTPNSKIQNRNSKIKDPLCRRILTGAQRAGARGPEWASTGLDREGLNSFSFRFAPVHVAMKVRP